MTRHSQHLVALLTALACVALHPAHAGAQVSPRPDTAAADSVRRLQAVEVTETRAVGTAGGSSAVVVNPKELRASPAPLLEEALRESPFVHVRQNSRGEMELSVRGSDSRQAAILLDGVPLSLGWDHRVDPSLVPLTGAQQLVIVRGLGTLLAGPNTLGGTIEVSHDAFAASRSMRGGAGVDEHGAFVTSLSGGGPLGADGALSLRGGLAHRSRDGFTLPSGASDPTSVNGLRTNSDLRETDGFALLRWSGSTGKSLGAMVTAYDAERGVPPEEHVGDPRLWRYPVTRRAVVALSGDAGAFGTPWGFAGLSGGLAYNAGHMEIESFSDRTYQTVVDTEKGDERTLTARSRLTHSLPAGARLDAAVTMTEIYYQETLGSDPPNDYRQRLWSTGAELNWPAGETALSGGVVYDHAATPLTGGRPAQPDQSSIGWRAGLTHDMNPTWRVHGSVSRRARFPALRELYSGALDRFVPNPDLRPETLLGVEVGTLVDRRIGFLPDATIQVNAFHHRLRDAVVRTTLPAPDSRFLRVNRDRIASTGLEMLAGVAFGHMDAEGREAVTVTGDALVQRIRVVDQNAGVARHAENNPEVRGMLELGVPLPASLRGFVNARYTGRQYCLNSETDLEMTLNAATETNLALERRLPLRRGVAGFASSLRLLLALDNVGDVAIYDQCGLPQPGRTLRLMVTLQ